MTQFRVVLNDGTSVTSFESDLEPPKSGTVMIIDTDTSGNSWKRYLVANTAWSMGQLPNGKHRVRFVLIWVAPESD
jgi:hypothetical protein